MTRFAKGLSLLSALALWQGCSSSSDTTDGSTDDASTISDAASDGPVLGLTRGMSYFKITTVTGITDGCEIVPADFVNAGALPVNYVNATQTLSVGNPQGAPVMASLGSGVIGVTGTLNRENDVTDTTVANCVWHQKDVSLFTLTGVDVFTLDVTETQSAFTAACAPILPAMNPCTTTYKATFVKTTAPADAGAGG